MRRWLPWIIGAIALAAIVVVGLNQAPESKTPSQPKVSKISAQELHAKLDGAPPALAALHAQANDLLPGARKGLQARVRALRGHPVVVNVWAAWCVPCRVELPVIQRASLDYGKRVAFLGVDLRDNRGAAAQAAARHPADLPVLRGPRRQGRQRLQPGRHAEHDLLRRLGQADLRPPGPVPRPRAARRGHQALRGVVTEVRPARDPVRGRRRAGAALRGLLRRAGREPRGRARRARRRGAAPRRRRRRRGRRHLPPAGRGLGGQARAHGGGAPRTAAAAWPPRCSSRPTPGHASCARGASCSPPSSPRRRVYERAGYAPYGDVFLDAGIEHVMMGKALE